MQHILKFLGYWKCSNVVFLNFPFQSSSMQQTIKSLPGNSWVLRILRYGSDFSMMGRKNSMQFFQVSSFSCFVHYSVEENFRHNSLTGSAFDVCISLKIDLSIHLLIKACIISYSKNRWRWTEFSRSFYELWFPISQRILLFVCEYFILYMKFYKWAIHGKGWKNLQFLGDCKTKIYFFSAICLCANFPVIDIKVYKSISISFLLI